MKEPKIRFKGFEGEWEEHSLSENEFSIVAGGDIDKTNLKNSGKFPVIANAITNDGILGYYENSYRVQEPAVTVTGRGEVGIAVARHYSFTPVVRLLSIKSPHNVDFLANAINCYKVPVESTGVPQLTTAKLQEYRIPMPRTIEEEDVIASFFTTIDAQISASTSRLASLKQIKAASLQAMFPQEGETVPKLRFKGFEGEWEKHYFSSLTYNAGIKNRDNLPLESYSISNEYGFIPQNEQFENGGTMASADKRMYYIVSPNSFAYNPARINVGSLGYYSGKKEVIVSSLYEVFKTEDIVFDDFLNYWFKTNLFKKQINLYQEGGVRLYFFYDKLCKCDILLPSKAEQRAIASYFTNLDRQITLQSQRLEKLKQIKAACLDKMFV